MNRILFYLTCKLINQIYEGISIIIFCFSDQTGSLGSLEASRLSARMKKSFASSNGSTRTGISYETHVWYKQWNRQWITNLIEGEDSRSRLHKCTCRRELSFCFHRLWYINKLFSCESFIIVLNLLDSIYTGWILFGLHGSAWSGNLSMYVEV